MFSESISRFQCRTQKRFATKKRYNEDFMKKVLYALVAGLMLTG